MTPRAAILFAAIALAASPAWAQKGRSLITPDIGTRVAEGFAAPALEKFTASADDLASAIDGLCQAPDSERLEATRAGFAEVISDWGRVSVLRFGPLQAENRFERIFFWPDPRGIALRQIQGLLAEKDESAATAAGLAEKSVALQGLPALEFVLFGSGSEKLAETGEEFRCRYAHAIARNVAAVAGAVEAAWQPGQPFHTAFTEPSPDRDLYRSSKEVAAEIVKALGTGLQFVLNAELAPALGSSPEEARGKRAPLWRSDLTFDLVAAQIAGLYDLFSTAGFEATLPADRAAIAASVRFELEHALEAVNEIQAPAETAFADEEARGRINYVTLALHGANHTLNDSFSAAIGLSMGFNALDGD